MTYRDRMIIGLLVLSSIIFFSTRKQCNMEKNYFSNLNLTLKGNVVAVDAVEGYNGFGIVKTKIMASSLTSYDNPDSTQYRYCYIHDGYAEFYQISARDCKIGDTIEVDTHQRIFKIIRGNSSMTRDILMNDDVGYLDYIWKYHRKF